MSAGHDSADSSYYSKSNGFEIECVYDVITGAYVGDLSFVPLQRRQAKISLLHRFHPFSRPKPSQSLRRLQVSPGDYRAYFSAAPVQPIQEAVCRANLKTLNTACRDLTRPQPSCLCASRPDCFRILFNRHC